MSDHVMTIGFAIANLLCGLGAAIAAWRSAAAGDAAVIATRQSVEVANLQNRLSQRQMLIPLWEYISNLKPIDADNPSPMDVVRGINTLELVALCCEAEVVDEAVIKRTFRAHYMQLYDQIKRVKSLQQLQNKSGDDLIRENRAAASFYKKLEGEHLGSDTPGSLTQGN